MIGYFFAIIPLYVLVYVPLSQIIFGSGVKRQFEDESPLELNSSFIATDDPLFCPSHSYNTYILSHEPLMVYIEGFLSPNESEHLVRVRYVFGFFSFNFPVVSSLFCLT
jgi:prolyl 4-hydroxylase